MEWPAAIRGYWVMLRIGRQAVRCHKRRRLASAGTDGIVQIFALDIGELLRQARSRVVRNLCCAITAPSFEV